MRVSEFNDLLAELGRDLQTQLSVDKNEACKIPFSKGPAVQLELTDDGQYLVLFAELGTLPAGRYREDLFEQALKSNGSANRGAGILSFADVKDLFALYDKLPANGLRMQRLRDHLKSFQDKATTWKEAVDAGRLPMVDTGRASYGSGIFGLR